MARRRPSAGVALHGRTLVQGVREERDRRYHAVDRNQLQRGPDEEPSIEDLGGGFVAACRADGHVEMIVEGDGGMIGRLAVLPVVLAVALAQDGLFADDTDGTVVIAEGGTKRQRLPIAGAGPR